MDDQATKPVDTGTFSMEQALQDVESRLEKTVSHGQIINGTVVMITAEGVLVDIGARAEAIIPFSQLSDDNLSEDELKGLLKVGEEITASVLRADKENGQVILSKKKVQSDQVWVKIQNLFDKGEVVSVTATEKVKGGLVATVEGIRAFLPASQVDLKRTPDLDSYVGQTFDAKVIEINRKKSRIILSRRTLLEAEQKAGREDVLAKLTPGTEVEGQVVEMTDFGVFVALGGVDGLVHRSEISWGRFNHPRDVVAKGDTVKARVLSIDNNRERVNLSLKALLSDPWANVAERFPIGSKVAGKVVGLTQFGAFVEVEAGLEGLVHISELSWTKRPKHPSEIVKEGDHVEAQVLRIDSEERRLSLGIKQTQPDPWKTLTDQYPPLTPVKGKVTGVTEFGVFVEILPGIEGLIHVSEIDWTRVEKPSLVFKKGDEVEAAIINIDPVDQRISLSRKKLLPMPAQPEGAAAPTGEEGRGERGRGGERGDNRRRAAGGKGGKTGGRDGNRERRGGRFDDIGEYGSATYQVNFDPTQASASNTSVKIGDLFDDLFSKLESK